MDMGTDSGSGLVVDPIITRSKVAKSVMEGGELSIYCLHVSRSCNTKHGYLKLRNEIKNTIS